MIVAAVLCLDLGSGAGVDAFVLARLVGPEGHVHGIDMTPEQLDVARRNAPGVAERFGFSRPNTTFHQGFIETADAIEDGSIDLVISDCVINLSPRKDLVLATAGRVLKEGGELYVSDIVADRRVPARLAEDPRLVAECIGSALYEHDWFDLLEEAGFRDARVVERAVLQSDVAGEPGRDRRRARGRAHPDLEHAQQRLPRRLEVGRGHLQQARRPLPWQRRQRLHRRPPSRSSPLQVRASAAPTRRGGGR